MNTFYTEKQIAEESHVIITLKVLFTPEDLLTTYSLTSEELPLNTQFS